MKALIAAIAALAAGIAGTAYVAQSQFRARLDSALAQAAELREEREALARQAASAADRLERIETQSIGLREEVEALRDELAAAREPAAEEFALVDELALEEESIAMAEPQAASGGESRDEGDRGRRRDEELTGEERAEREERRQQWQAQMQERVAGFYEQQIAQAGGAAEQGRLALMSEYTQDMAYLFGEMRAAGTDEERQQIAQDLRVTRQGLGELVQEQQDHIITSALERSGVTDPERQSQLAAAFRNLQNSPFFSPGLMNGMMGGFGGGGRGSGAPPLRGAGGGR